MIVGVKLSLTTGMREREDLVRMSGQLVNRLVCSVDNPVKCKYVSMLLLRE